MRWGGELCSFFFIISGFLYKYSPNYWGYIKRKVLNIFPIYYICLIILLLGRTYTGHLHLGLDILPHLFLIQSWLPEFYDSLHFYLGPAWFISSLFFCYLISPLCYKLIERNNKYVSIAILISLIITVHTIGWEGNNVYFTYISPIERLFEYMLGMSLGFVVKSMGYKKEPFSGMMLLVIIFYLLLIKYLGLNWILIFIHPMILALIWMYESPLLNCIFANRVVMRLASAGMFIYLSHNAIKMAVPGSWSIKTIVCVIVGFVLNELYQYILTRLKTT